MTCFLYKNKPIIGITYFPKFNATFWVYSQHKNSLNFNNISKILNVKRHPKTYNIIQSRSHSHSHSSNNSINTLFQHLLNNSLNNINEKIHLEKAGGAGYKTILVAGNISDVYFHNSSIKLWDICNSVVYSQHFEYLNVYDINLNNLKISTTETVLKNGFILSSNSTLLSKLFQKKNKVLKLV